MHNLQFHYFRQNEGLRLKPYLCTKEKLTIGFGRNLNDRGISKEEAEILLANDVASAIRDLCVVFGERLFYDLVVARQMVLIDMVINMGLGRFRGFKNMIQAVKDKWWDKAAYEILDSKYAREDVPNRAKRNAELMRKGQ